jgi:hypothetical protein
LPELIDLPELVDDGNADADLPELVVNGDADADLPQLVDAADAAPAADGAAGAVMVAADGGGAAAAAAVDGGGGAGEVMLEDVGAIVDGLIGNLQEGAVPVHLQRIIERFGECFT